MYIGGMDAAGSPLIYGRPTFPLSNTSLHYPLLCQPHFDDFLKLLLTSPRSQDGECPWVSLPILALYRLVKSFGLLR